jgi:hypothetical protein
MMPTVIRSRDELLQVLRARRDELDLSHGTIDGISGACDGYTGKLLCDPPVRGFGAESLAAILGALALRMVRVEIIEDPQQAERVRARWKPRQRKPTRRAPVVRCCDIAVIAKQHKRGASSMKNRMVGARVDAELYSELEAAAEKARRTLSDWVRVTLIVALENSKATPAAEQRSAAA